MTRVDCERSLEHLEQMQKDHVFYQLHPELTLKSPHPSSLVALPPWT